MEEKKLVLCDTNIIIEFYKENPIIVEALRQIGQNNIAISIVTVGELIYGALNKKEQQQIEKDIAHLYVIPLDAPACGIFTQLMIKYALSHTLQVPDALIAASALQNDILLYTLNKKDFQYIDGLKMYES